MAPTNIEAAEISQAFSTGTVESMIPSPTTGNHAKIWRNGEKYFYDIAARLAEERVNTSTGAETKCDQDTHKNRAKDDKKDEKKDDKKDDKKRNPKTPQNEIKRAQAFRARPSGKPTIPNTLGTGKSHKKNMKRTANKDKTS